MKTLFVFLLGLVAGGFAMRYYDDQNEPRRAVASAGERAKDTAAGVGEDISDKMRQWHLTREDIRDDLARTGQVVRSKARAAGERIGDARIAAVVKAKYLLDRNLSAPAIEVDVKDGDVVLTGTVASPDLVGRAVALALDTDGVQNVAAHLTVR